MAILEALQEAAREWAPKAAVLAAAMRQPLFSQRVYVHRDYGP